MSTYTEQADVPPPSAAPRASRAGSVSDFLNRFGLLVAWAGVIAVFSLLRPATFFTTVNFQTILSSQAVLLVLCLGLIIPLTAGELDLSIAGVMGLSVMLVGNLSVNHHWPLAATVAVAIVAGFAVGAVNVFFVLVIGIESIVVTLGTGTVLTGLALAISGAAIGGIPQALVNVSGTQIFGIQAVFYYALLLTLVCWYVYALTPLGRYLYFVGASRDVSRLAGLRVDLIRGGALIAGSVIASVAGVLLTGLQGTADPNVAPSYLLPAFAGAFLGATAITPGRFNPAGSFIGVYFLVTGITGLELLGLSGWIEQVFYGSSLVLAVTLSTLAARRNRLSATA
jgi:ribose transport system permease protein